MGERICLRCDWTGVDAGTACPTCRSPLYRVPETTTREVRATRPRPEPLGGRTSGSRTEMTQDDESVLPAVPVAASRRGWVIAGGAFAVAAIWIVATGGPFARLDAKTASGPALAVATTPVDEPPTANPANASAEEAALGFVDAFAAFDAQKAMTFVNDKADLTGMFDAPANAKGLSLMLSLLKAMGFEQTVTSCETAAFGSDTSAVCDFDFHMLGSDRIGRGPFSGSHFVFTVRDGAIVRASIGWNMVKFEPQMWQPFAEWVSSTYPKDVAVMYQDGTLPRSSPESIRLWERHTREYVEEVKRGTA